MSGVIFYNNVDPALKSFIHHYWYIEDKSVEQGAGKLLPMDHVDMIVTAESTFTYESNQGLTESGSVHFHGIRLSSVTVIPIKNIKAFGISFQPWGCHKLIGADMNMFVDQIVDLKTFDSLLAEDLRSVIRDSSIIEDIVSEIEKLLLPYFDEIAKEMNEYDIVRKYIESEPSDIEEYCYSMGLSVRQLNRYFNKIVGVSPKAFLNLRRFEDSSRAVLYEDIGNLTEVAYKSKYYDQSHFVRNFKRFTSYTPKHFKIEKPALKSKLYKNSK